MPVRICPRCQQQYLHDANNTDYVHECNSGTAVLDNEDIIDIPNVWTDYTGTGKSLSKTNVKGVVNGLFGTRAGLEGEKSKSTLTETGPIIF